MRKGKITDDVGALFREVERISRLNHGGHYTIYSFTSGYRGFYGTVVDLERLPLDELSLFPHYCTLRELLVGMIANPERFNALAMKLHREVFIERFGITPQTFDMYAEAGR